ncbi:hypothetical protein NMY22_g13785 [Coprinellus aureogranulatus]|nr:hypothetical protein NMY22_g13785 [Coprinellus aureogranulatus]
MASTCTIPANPDIAGIGVRIAIYVQNLLCFIPAIWAIWDGKVSDYELESIETQSTTNLILAFALLISCIVQAFTLGLTNYHASIVLSMSWTNNTIAFIYFLLYVHYKGQEGPGRSPVRPRWSAWLAHVRLGGGRRGDERIPSSDEENQNGQRQWGGKRAATKIIFRRIALFLGSLHLTVMGALGLWLWSSPSTFGNSDPNSSCASEFANLAILGARVPFASNPLRIFSLVIYSLFVLPGFNLLLPMAAFLSVFVWHNSRRSREATLPISTSGPLPRFFGRHRMRRLRAIYIRCMQSSILPVCIGLAFLFTVNVILIVDIELTLRRNRSLQATGEGEWGFGQVLAVLLLFMPLRDLLEMVLARRQRRQEMQIREHEWREALHLGDVDKIVSLVRTGVDPNDKAGDGRTALEVVALAGNWDAVREVVNAGANVKTEFQSDSYGTVLQAASATDSARTVKLLLDKGADPLARGGKHEETCLHTACFNNRPENVKLLLERQVNPNVQDNKGKTPLHTASRGDYTDCARYLLEAHADPSIQTFRGETPLHSACWERSAEYTKVLLQYGADPNVKNKERGLTPLHIACWRASPQSVRYLLEAGADPNIRAHNNETPLELLRRLRPGKDLDIIRLLQERGAVQKAVYTRCPLEALDTESRKHTGYMRLRGNGKRVQRERLGHRPVSDRYTSSFIQLVEIGHPVGRTVAAIHSGCLAKRPSFLPSPSRDCDERPPIPNRIHNSRRPPHGPALPADEQAGTEDMCRKKMKRAERRGTLESQQLAAQQQLAQAASLASLHQSQTQSQGLTRTDTLPANVTTTTVNNKEKDKDKAKRTLGLRHLRSYVVDVFGGSGTLRCPDGVVASLFDAAETTDSDLLPCSGDLYRFAVVPTSDLRRRLIPERWRFPLSTPLSPPTSFILICLVHSVLGSRPSSQSPSLNTTGRPTSTRSLCLCSSMGCPQSQSQPQQPQQQERQGQQQRAEQKSEQPKPAKPASSSSAPASRQREQQQQQSGKRKRGESGGSDDEGDDDELDDGDDDDDDE